MYYFNFPGGFGNFLTILVITRNNHLHNHMTPLLLNLAFGNLCITRINDIAIAMSYSSRADPGLRVAFKYLNV